MIEKLIKKIAQKLDSKSVDYMIIGGQAVLLYGSPRLTRDIDITLCADTDKFQIIKKICTESGLRILPENPEDFAVETKVLPAEDVESNIRIDFIFSFTPYETEAFKRTKEVFMDGYPVKFASCEDVIIHKMVAARAIDEEDVRTLLVKNRKSLDVDYIRKWLLEFGKLSEQQGVLKRFENLMKQ